MNELFENIQRLSFNGESVFKIVCVGARVLAGTLLLCIRSQKYNTKASVSHEEKFIKYKLRRGIYMLNVDSYNELKYNMFCFLLILDQVEDKKFDKMQ